MSTAVPTTLTKASTFVVSALGGLSCSVRHRLLTIPVHIHQLDVTTSDIIFVVFTAALIPVVGDVADAVLNYRLVVRKAVQADIPPWLLRKMLFNNTISAGLSYVPSNQLNNVADGLCWVIPLMATQTLASVTSTFNQCK